MSTTAEFSIVSSMGIVSHICLLRDRAASRWLGECISVSVLDAGAGLASASARHSGQSSAPGAPTRPPRLQRRNRGRVARQDALELAARGDVELGEDLAQVVLDRRRADEQPDADFRVREPSRASRAICASRAVSSSRVSSVRLRTVSPVASSSRPARSANASAPIVTSISWARCSCSRASTRLFWRRSHSP